MSTLCLQIKPREITVQRNTGSAQNAPEYSAQVSVSRLESA